MKTEVKNLKTTHEESREALRKHFDTSVDTNSKFKVMFDNLYTPEGLQRVKVVPVSVSEIDIKAYNVNEVIKEDLKQMSSKWKQSMLLMSVLFILGWSISVTFL